MCVNFHIEFLNMCAQVTQQTLIKQKGGKIKTCREKPFFQIAGERDKSSNAAKMMEAIANGQDGTN